MPSGKKDLSPSSFSPWGLRGVDVRADEDPLDKRRKKLTPPEKQREILARRKGLKSSEEPCSITSEEVNQSFDLTFSDQIDEFFSLLYSTAGSQLSYFSFLKKISDIIIGAHFKQDYIRIILGLGKLNDDNDMAKGLLDFLIFPLVARSLIYDSRSRESGIINSVIKALSWLIIIPLEIARFSLGATLSIALLPISTLFYLGKVCVDVLNRFTMKYSQSLIADDLETDSDSDERPASIWYSNYA